MSPLTRALALLICLTASAIAAAELEFRQVEAVPTARLQWGDAALIAPEHFVTLGIEPGQQAFLRTESGGNIAVYLLPIDRDPGTVSLKRELRDRLGVDEGAAVVRLHLATPAETGMPEADLSVSITTQSGRPHEWPGMVLGAPHGDSDNSTGDIAEVIADMTGIPTVVARRGRASFMGRWIDVNRPLQREPTQLFRISASRSWTADSEAVYHRYRDAIVGLAAAGKPHDAQPPVDLYIDFHGHGLTVTTPDGESVGRYVVEVMTRGFSIAEVRMLKSTFDGLLRAEYADEAPPSYWGNLPEDRRYVVAGVETPLTYSGLGTRVGGTLGPHVSRRAIHIELPGRLRTVADNRPRTAQVMATFLTAVRDGFVPAGHDWRAAPGGEFTIGGAPGEDEDAADPLLVARLSPFEVTHTEITNRQYAAFANDALQSGRARVVDGALVESETQQAWLLLAPHAAYSGIAAHGNGVVALAQLVDHPVVNVTWHGASAYATHHDARLPTEAEWEYAAKWDPARGIAVGWSEAADPTHATLPAGNYLHSPQREAGHITGATTPVGSFPEHASPIGCVDMIGNAWEWTADWNAPYPRTRQIHVDPRGPDEGTMKTVRGGSWDTEPSTTEAAHRFAVAPHTGLPTVGFRIVRASSAAE